MVTYNLGDIPTWVQAISAAIMVIVLVGYQLRSQKRYEAGIMMLADSISSSAFGRHSLELVVEFSRSYINLMDEYYDMHAAANINVNMAIQSAATNAAGAAAAHMAAAGTVGANASNNVSAASAMAQAMAAGFSAAIAVSRPEVTRSAVERWHRRFWDLQFHQFQAWVDGYVRDDLMMHWMRARASDFANRESIAIDEFNQSIRVKISFSEGWCKIRDSYVTKAPLSVSDKFAATIDLILTLIGPPAHSVTYETLSLAKAKADVLKGRAEP